MSVEELAEAFGDVDAIVSTAGSNGGSREFTKAVDVAETVAELLHEPGIGRQILELNTGSTPIRDAVKANAHRR